MNAITAAMLDSGNPYQSPRYTGVRALSEDREWINAIRVHRVEHKHLYRRVVIEAPLAADLEYCGFYPHDTVSIDGQLAASKLSVWWFVPRFEFELMSGGQRVPIVVEVRMGILLNIRAFRVQIAGETVYCEGNWKPGKQS